MKSATIIHRMHPLQNVGQHFPTQCLHKGAKKIGVHFVLKQMWKHQKFTYKECKTFNIGL